MDFTLPALLPLQVIALEQVACAGSSWTPRLLSSKSPLGTPFHVCTSLFKQQMSPNPNRWVLKVQGAEPQAHYTFFPVKEDPSCTSYLLPVLHEIVGVDNYSPAPLDLQNYLTFLGGFLHQREAFARLTAFLAPLCFDQNAFFSPGSPSQHSSAFNSLFLCQDSLQEWGLYEDIIAWERNVIKRNI